MTSGEEPTATTFRARIPVRYKAALGVLGLTAAGGSALAALEAGPLPLVTGLLIAAVFVPILMMTARISVGEDGVRIRVAALFSTQIRYGEITGISAGPVTGLREGMGLRILPDGTGYLVGGPSIRIDCGNTCVVVSCTHPEQLLACLGPRLEAAAGR